jgi:hypothetical protein
MYMSSSFWDWSEGISPWLDLPMPRLALQRCLQFSSRVPKETCWKCENLGEGIDILRISEDSMNDSMVITFDATPWPKMVFFIGPQWIEHKIFHRDFLRFHCSDFYWKPWYACIIGVNEVNLLGIHYEFLSRWGPNRSYVGRPSKKRELQTSRQNLIEFIATNDSSPRAKLGRKKSGFRLYMKSFFKFRFWSISSFHPLNSGFHHWPHMATAWNCPPGARLTRLASVLPSSQVGDHETKRPKKIALIGVGYVL